MSNRKLLCCCGHAALSQGPRGHAARRQGPRTRMLPLAAGMLLAQLPLLPIQATTTRLPSVAEQSRSREHSAAAPTLQRARTSSSASSSGTTSSVRQPSAFLERSTSALRAARADGGLAFVRGVRPVQVRAPLQVRALRANIEEKMLQDETFEPPPEITRCDRLCTAPATV